MKSKLRTLVVDGERYLYRLESRYVGDPRGAFFARATCVVYLDGHKTSPGRISFVTPADAQAGAPLNSGYTVTLESGSALTLNLNEPRHAASVIRLLLKLGWQPRSGKAFAVEDGREHLAALEGEK